MAVTEYIYMRELSHCPFVIQATDIYFWEEKIKKQSYYTIWIKLELAEQSFENCISTRMDEGRPFLKIELVRIIYDILLALIEAKKLQIYNRDIKPSNILMNPLRICLSDFGIAKKA